METVYGVWAVRSAASIFGHAEAWCKEDGRPLIFPTYEAAAAYAMELNGHTLSANVHYYPKEKVRERGDHLRNAELSEEGQTGNYNMLDGIINNEPPVKPDLTDGQTHGELRELAPEALPENQASLMERLREARQDTASQEQSHGPRERER